MTERERLILDGFGPHVLLNLARCGEPITTAAITLCLFQTGDLRAPCLAEVMVARRSE